MRVFVPGTIIIIVYPVVLEAGEHLVMLYTCHDIIYCCYYRCCLVEP